MRTRSRFAIAAAAGEVVGRFVPLVVGGAAAGLVIGAAWVWVARRLADEVPLIVATVLVGWIAYLSAEAPGVSGVIAAVAALRRLLGALAGRLYSPPYRASDSRSRMMVGAISCGPVITTNA